jgi:hypothetical protein
MELMQVKLIRPARSGKQIQVGDVAIKKERISYPSLKKMAIITDKID